MPVCISNLAHSIRKSSLTDAVPVLLGHAQQLVAAAMGYQTFASYQAAQAAGQEPSCLDSVSHVVPDYAQLDTRAAELGVAVQPSRLHELLETAFSARLPQSRLHSSYGSLEVFLREQVQQVAMEDDDVNAAMVNANYDGIDEVYFDFEIEFDEATIGNSLTIDLDGHVGLGVDMERPYTGHKVNVEGALTLQRLGRHCFAAADCLIIKAELDDGWAKADDDEQDDGPPVRSRSQAYADLLGLELHEVGSLVDVEPKPLEGQSGDMLFGFMLDFTDYVSQEVAAKILQRHGSLLIEVHPGFFDNVRDDDWPN